MLEWVLERGRQAGNREEEEERQGKQGVREEQEARGRAVPCERF